MDYDNTASRLADLEYRLRQIERDLNEAELEIERLQNRVNDLEDHQL